MVGLVVTAPPELATVEASLLDALDSAEDRLALSPESVELRREVEALRLELEAFYAECDRWLDAEDALLVAEAESRRGVQ